MPRLTPKTALWLWLIFGGIFAASGISTFLNFRNAWKAYRDSRKPK